MNGERGRHSQARLGKGHQHAALVAPDQLATACGQQFLHNVVLQPARLRRRLGVAALRDASRFRDVDREQRAQCTLRTGGVIQFRREQSLRLDAVDANRPADVLELAFAEVAETDRDAVMHVLPDRFGDDNVPGRAQLMNARRDVHTVADEPPLVDEDVADIDADAQPELASRGFDARLGRLALQVERPAHRIHRAGELHEYGITCEVDESTRMFADLRFDQSGAQCVPGAHSFELVRFNEMGPTCDIGKGHCGEAPRNACHLTRPFRQREGRALDAQSRVRPGARWQNWMRGTLRRFPAKKKTESNYL